MSQKRPLEAIRGDRTLNIPEQVELNFTTDFNVSMVDSNLKDTVLDLKWSVRNLIISNLYSHSSFLIQKISDKLKAERMKENFELIQTLMNLPAASYQKEKPKNKRAKLDEDAEDEIILDLSWTDRDLIVDNLMKNHHCAIMYSHLVSRTIKDNLTNENNQLVTVLTNLRVREIEDDDVMADEEASASGYTPSGEESGTSKESGHSGPGTQAESDVNKTIITEFAEIKRELSGLREIKQYLLENGLSNKPEITYNFNVPLSKLEERKPFFSSPFQCHGIQWSVKSYAKSVNGTDYLSVFIQPDLKTTESCEVITEFRLLNRDEWNAIRKPFNYTFTKSLPCGFQDFAEMRTLLDKQSGFTNQKDEIELEIYMKITHKSVAEI